MIRDYFWESSEEIKGKIADLICQKKLTPVIGSGFTRRCEARNGKVPSGNDMSDYLVAFAAKSYSKPEEYFKNKNFTELCTYYDKKSTVDERFEYFSSFFTEVKLSEDKIAFIKLFPEYVYTLNVDDGIESNCREYNIVLPRKEFSDQYINAYSIVFKVHGDVHHYLKYVETEELIFNKRQYIESIKSNKKMLAKFKDDFSENNLLYIGCSLEEEPDLLSVVADSVKERRSDCQSYYVTGKVLDEDERDLLEDYGVTACIVVKDYANFYTEIYQLSEMRRSDITVMDIYKEPEIICVEREDTTIDYMLNSNALIKYPFDGKIYKPSFFGHRDAAEAAINQLKNKSPIHIVYGHRISGKTFYLVDIYEMVKDKTRYFFPSNTKIGNMKLREILEQRNSLFIFDTNCLTSDQIYKIAKAKRMVTERDNYIVIAVNSSDRNNLDLITDSSLYGTSNVKNIVSNDELDQLNKKLQYANLPTFINKEIVVTRHVKKEKLNPVTILDNLCKIAGKFGGTSIPFHLPDFTNSISLKKLSLLIILATDQVLRSYDLIYFDLYEEARKLAKDYPTYFELEYSDINLSRMDSRTKLITNSRYFLLEYLGNYAKSKDNYKDILLAYRYVYNSIYNAEEAFEVPRKMLDYIKFDVMNDVFYRNNKSVIELIKYVYEGLEDVMNVNPQFKHQRAKSIFWLCDESYEDILEATKYVDLARYDIENILKSKHNDKLQISLEHVKYTQASIWGRLCNLEGYNKEESILLSLQYYEDALNSPQNYEECQALKNKRAEKRIYEDLVNILKYVLEKADTDTMIEFHARTLSEMLGFENVIR